MKKSRASWFWVLALITCCATVFLAEATTAAPTPATPVLIELFTSEGCSSCPPADAFLRALDSSQPIPGEQLIVLEEHVDYWDDQGWKDPFSSHDLTQRQADYDQRLGVQGPYTPEMIVDGAYEFVGNDRAKADAALKKAQSMQTIAVRISGVTVADGKLQAHIETDAVPAKADVMVAVVLDHAESQVLRGENGGHHLEHVAVVTSLSKVGKTEKQQPFSKDIRLSGKSLTQPFRVIAFLQEPGQGKILGATEERVAQ